MAKKNRNGAPVTSVSTSQSGSQAASKPSEVAELLLKTEALLQAGEPQKALDLIERAKTKSPWLTNAMGVCQLRLGNAECAVDLFRRLTLGPGGLIMRVDAPTVFKTNYAAALLASGNVSGCLSALGEIGEEHSAIGDLQGAIQRWKKSMPLWKRIGWYLGGDPDRPVVLDFPLGHLE